LGNEMKKAKEGKRENVTEIVKQKSEREKNV
jgi:hypothetical protein